MFDLKPHTFDVNERDLHEIILLQYYLYPWKVDVVMKFILGQHMLPCHLSILTAFYTKLVFLQNFVKM